MDPELIAALIAAERAQKPRIRRSWHSGFWECSGQGRRAIGNTMAAAYRSWRAAAQWADGWVSTSEPCA